MFIGLSCTAGSSLFAQRDTIPSDSVQLLTPVEVRSTRLNEKSPFAVSNIGKKEIAKQKKKAEKLKRKLEKKPEDEQVVEQSEKVEETTGEQPVATVDTKEEPGQGQ